jgi:hypothetical protein
VNAANYYGAAVFSGTMTGASMSINLPMNSLPALPTGMDAISDAAWRASLNTLPEFGVFVVIPN